MLNPLKLSNVRIFPKYGAVEFSFFCFLSLTHGFYNLLQVVIQNFTALLVIC